MFFSKKMKQIILDKEILKRLQRSELSLYLTFPIFTALFMISFSFLLSYQAKQDWHPFIVGHYTTSVYAHGEVFTDIRESGTPRMVERFSDYGLDYRNFKEKERLVLLEYNTSNGKIKELYPAKEFNRLNKEANRKSNTQIIIFTLSMIALLIISLLLFTRDFMLGLRWLKSSSDDVNDLYSLLRKTR